MTKNGTTVDTKINISNKNYHQQTRSNKKIFRITTIKVKIQNSLSDKSCLIKDIIVKYTKRLPARNVPCFTGWKFEILLLFIFINFFVAAYISVLIFCTRYI
jgi:hypothetical protein